MLLLYADYKEEGLYEKNIYFGPLRFRVLLHSVRSTEPIFLLRKKTLVLFPARYIFRLKPDVNE